jgi:hypothetical protein
MKEVDQLIYARLIGDTQATVGLVPILGTAAHIMHSFQNVIPVVPYLTFDVYSAGKGLLGGNFARTLDYFYQFNIFANHYDNIITRLRQLFDGYIFTVPGNYTEVGQIKGVFDFEGPDGYDEQLEVQSKQVRFRFFVTPKAWNPITA